MLLVQKTRLLIAGVRWAVLIVGLGVCGFIAPVHAASARAEGSAELFGGALGGWLRSDALPELTTLVGKHPRFKGELVRVVNLSGGEPDANSNGLVQALREQLTQRLTRVKGVQIAWREPKTLCGVRRAAPYLLGVEVVALARNRYTVTLALIDVEEGVFVNGGYLQWRGSLTAEERNAFSRRVADGATGTIDAPLPAASRARIARHLIDNISCALSGGLEGGVRVVAADAEDPLLANLAVDIRAHFTRSAAFELVQDGSKAEWELNLSSSQQTGEAVVAALVATENSRRPAAGAQRLAAVFVRRANAAGGSALANAMPAQPRQPGVKRAGSTARSAPATVPEGLIEQLHEVPSQPGDQCYRPEANCIEVAFEVNYPSYLLVLRTAPGGSLSLGTCGSPRRVSGSKRYRLKIRDSGAGFYAVATQDAEIAARLHRTLAAGAGNCGARSRGNWLDILEGVLTAAGERVDWRTYQIPPRYIGGPDSGEAVATAARSRPHAGAPIDRSR